MAKNSYEKELEREMEALKGRPSISLFGRKVYRRLPEKRLRPLAEKTLMIKKEREAYEKGLRKSRLSRAGRMGALAARKPRGIAGIFGSIQTSARKRVRSPFDISPIRPMGTPSRVSRDTLGTVRIPGKRGRPKKIENLSPSELRARVQALREKKQLQSELIELQRLQGTEEVRETKKGVSVDIFNW